jgi:hypothetical protein
MATNKPKVDASGLLKSMTAQVSSMEKSPVQHVQPVDKKTVKTENSLNGKTLKQEAGISDSDGITEKRENNKTFKRENVKTESQQNGKTVTGRPTVKKQDTEYIKISPKIPEFIKVEAGKALLDKRFVSTEGFVIKTMDELVSHALEKLLFGK